MSSKASPRGAPFSTHSRGVPLITRTSFVDIAKQLALLLLDLRDLSSLVLYFLACQSYYTFWTALITLISVVFFTFFDEKYTLAYNLDWTFICCTVVLPLVGFTWIAYGRRERALDQLSKVKVLMMAVYLAHRDWAPQDKASLDHLATVRAAIKSITDSMRDYFLSNRFYSRYYPYFGFRRAMVQIALDRARHVRQVGLALQQLSAAAAALRHAGLSAALEAQLHDRVFQLHLGLEKLANVKEFRTPQGVRTLARVYICLIIPIFYGPYWSSVAAQMGFAFTLFYSVLLMISAVGILNVALALEDPFDNRGMDGIFIDEPLYEVEQLMSNQSQGLAASEGGVWLERPSAVGAAGVVGPQPDGMVNMSAGSPGAVAAAAAGGQLPQQIQRVSVSRLSPQTAANSV